jgi:hypothetical protein
MLEKSNVTSLCVEEVLKIHPINPSSRGLSMRFLNSIHKIFDNTPQISIIINKEYEFLKFFIYLGRTRLEPVAIIILSVIMCAASVSVIFQSITTVVSNAQYFTETNKTKTLSDIDMSAFPISIMVITSVTKSVLFFFCYRIKTPTLSALATDHRNDVASNIVALICGLIGILYRN